MLCCRAFINPTGGLPLCPRTILEVTPSCSSGRAIFTIFPASVSRRNDKTATEKLVPCLLLCPGHACSARPKPIRGVICCTGRVAGCCGYLGDPPRDSCGAHLARMFGGPLRTLDTARSCAGTWRPGRSRCNVRRMSEAPSRALACPQNAPNTSESLLLPLFLHRFSDPPTVQA